MEKKGLIASIFDLSFSEFVTTRVIKVLFVLGIIVTGIYSIAFIVGGFSQGAGKGFLALLLSPLVFLLGCLAARIYMELLMVIFRIAENTSKLAAEKTEGA